ncbi:MAG: MFS transporter [Staphylothermus sp.]|nr:MFS transporter [Staphylothermus sp.]
MMNNIKLLDSDKKTTLFILYVYTLIRGAGRASYMFLYSLYLISIGYSTKDLGLIMTLAAASIVLILPIVGYLVDHGWSSEMLFLSGISMALSLIVPVLYPSFPFLILSYALNLLSLYLWSPSRNKIIGLIIPPVLMGRIYGVFALLFNSSRTITPFILGRLTEVLGYGSLMLWMGFFSLVGSIIVYVCLLRYGNTLTRTPLNKLDLVSSYKAMFSFDRSVFPVLLFAVIDRFSWRLWYPLLNAYFKEYRLFDDAVIGDFNTLIGLSMLVSSYLAGSITDVIKPTKALIIYELIGVAGLLSINLSYPYIYLSALLIGFSVAFWIPAYNTLITVMYGVEKVGRLRVLADSARNVTSIPAPQIGGYLMSVNPWITFMLSAFLMLSAIIPLKKISIDTNST